MEINKLVKVELSKKGYEPKTIGIYSNYILNLQKYYSPKSLEDITFDEIKEYLNYLKIRRKVGVISQNQAKKSFVFWYNGVLKKNFNFNEISIPRTFRRSTPDIFDESEILDLISKTDSIKIRVLLSLTYGCGFETGEISTIKLADLDLERLKIKVKFQRAKKIREAIIPSSIVDDIKIYIKEFKPEKWFFEGQKKGSKMSVRSVQHSFNKTFEKTGIKKNLSFRSLRYSYIKHLQRQGVSMLSILSELNLSAQNTYVAFSTIGETIEDVSFSPLDNLFGIKSKSEFKVDSLLKTVEKLNNDDEKEFLIESIKCLKNGFVRAGIIMSWNAAIRNIHYKLLKHSLHSLNLAIEKHQKGAKEIKTVDDFAHLKESVVLNAAMDLNEFDKNEKNILETCLELRNKCSHPGKYKPEEYRVAGFIEDLITIVLSK